METPPDLLETTFADLNLELFHEDSDVRERQRDVRAKTEALLASISERIELARQVMAHLRQYLNTNHDKLRASIGPTLSPKSEIVSYTTGDSAEEGKAFMDRSLIEIERALANAELILMGSPMQLDRESFEACSKVIELLTLMIIRLPERSEHPQADYLIGLFVLVGRRLDDIKLAQVRTPEKLDESNHIADFIILLRAGVQVLDSISQKVEASSPSARLNDEDIEFIRGSLRDVVFSIMAFLSKYGASIGTNISPVFLTQFKKCLGYLSALARSDILSIRLLKEAIRDFGNATENLTIDYRELVLQRVYLPQPESSAGKSVLKALEESFEGEEIFGRPSRRPSGEAVQAN